MLGKSYHKTEKSQGTNVLFCEIQEAEMGKIITKIFKSRDKPVDRTAGSSYSFFLGSSSSGKYVTERSAMQMTAVYCYISNEGLSLVENAAYLGLPIPTKLHKVLEQLHDRAEKEDEKDGEE